MAHAIRFGSRFSRTALVLALSIAGVGTLPLANAAAPQVRTAAPGYYRVILGDFEITALSDGTVQLPVDKLLTNTTPKAVQVQLKTHRQQSPLETSVNGYLINTGRKLILVDTGAAALFGPTLGKLVSNLKASGYTPEQVDEIYITHFHPDHVGGLADGDKAAFPNAIVRADKKDTDFWLSKENLDKAPTDSKGFFLGAQTSLAPYVKADKLKPFEGNTDLVPGIKAIASYGHTAGHTIYAIESKGEKLMLWGDLMHVAAVQFAHPEVTIQFDSDSKAAKAERLKAYADAAKHGYLVAGAHLSFPGIGYVRKDGKGYAWTPINYVPSK
jgi:glyoxylase-like metal-dependent hydrolase (beta-lactamase superfamily II)